jgi:hypothetical protein
MGEAENGSAGFRPGQRAKARVCSHQRWGLSVEIAGREGIRASIDYLDIDGPDRGKQRPDDFPIGSEVVAVVMKHLGDRPPCWLHLMIPDAPS